MIPGTAFLNVTYPARSGGGRFYDAYERLTRSIKIYVVSPEEKDALDAVFPPDNPGLVLGPFLILVAGLAYWYFRQY